MRIFIKESLLLISIFIITSMSVFGAEVSTDSSDGKEVDSVGNFINPKVGVASRLGTTLRSAPSVVSVITGEEIQRMGARDMNDVLMMVPGLFPGLDVQGVTDFGVRGLWAHEGKMLLEIDGREYNENGYGTSQFGNHFPVQLIERVEVIRGPGSAIYGGYAELGVVNIVTKTAKDLNGVFVGAQGGFTANTYGQENISFGVGKEIKDFTFSATGMIGRGQRSDRNYTDSQGSVVNLTGQSPLNSMFFNVAAAYKDLDFRLIVDQYSTKSIDWYGINLPVADDNNFKSYFAHLRYKMDVNDHFVITPEFRYRYMSSWSNTSVPVSDPNYFNYPTQRLKIKLGSVYTWSPELKLNVGIEAIEDTAWSGNALVQSILPSGASSVSYWTGSLFSELFYNFGFAELTAGGRFNYNTFVKGNFAPRIALVKPYENWHWKLMWGQAFRAPAIFNIAANTAIQPETTTSYEAEVGFKPTSRLALSVNLFNLVISQPIIYTTNSAGASFYANANKVGSIGGEFETRYAADWGDTRFNYSYYHSSQNAVAAYTVPQDDQVYLAFPSHKIALQSSIKLGSNDFRLTPSLVGFTSRYAYADNVNLPSTLPASVLVNLNLRKENLLFNGLSASVGIFNLTDQSFKIAQSYVSSGAVHPPLPTLGRDYVCQLTYQTPI